MKRRDWKEIEDLAGCPNWLRDAMTGYLQVVIDRAGPYDAAVPILSGLLDQLDSGHVLDLASGGGGPWPALAEKLGRRGTSLRVTLSDIAPSREAAARIAGVDGFEYRSEPLSALRVPTVEAGVWTMFTGLHHFGPTEVSEIMRQAQTRRVGFAAFEATQRSIVGLLTTLFIPLLVILLMPSVRPRRLLPLLLTYLVPIMPLAIWWDGFVSTLRTHTVPELEAIAEAVTEPGYVWTVSELEVPRAPVPVLALVGRPVRS